MTKLMEEVVFNQRNLYQNRTMHSIESGGTTTNNTGFPFYLDTNLADGKKLGLLPM